jgi:hypothetical protein
MLKAIVEVDGRRATRVSLLPGNRCGPSPAGRPAAAEYGDVAEAVARRWWT